MAVKNKNGPDTRQEQVVDTKKLARIEREKKDLLASIAGADFSTQKAKVASILNLYPESRNSDVALALKYWETFQPDIYSNSGILPKDLFKLERFHYIVRARAKIQNEYGLFQADDTVRHHRKKNEEVMYDAVIENTTPRKVVYVFADETGKTQDFVIVAAVWVLRAPEVYRITHKIMDWKDKSAWARREIHFSKFGKADFDTLKEYYSGPGFLGHDFMLEHYVQGGRSWEKKSSRLLHLKLSAGASTGRKKSS